MEQQKFIVALVLLCIIVGFIYAYQNYLTESFINTPSDPTLNPNILYSRYPNGQLDNGSCAFSQTYKATLKKLGGNESTSYNSKFCSNSSCNSATDPCPAILQQSQAQIPPEELAQCQNAIATPAPNASSSSLQNLTDAEMDELVYKYAVLTSQRNPVAPWDFNNYGSPSISM
jgi:hypothetical protein